MKHLKHLSIAVSLAASMWACDGSDLRSPTAPPAFLPAATYTLSGVVTAVMPTGHYSAGITARGDKDTPVLAELETIARHPVRDHVILIDDARCFDGSHDYPKLQEIQEFALRHWPDHTFEVKDDIVRILPRAEGSRR